MTELLATGPRLKAERERRGLSSQKAADELHLDGWVIDALEAENFDRVGPSVYAKGHLRRYAALLGLPADEIMAGYESRAQAPKPAAAPMANVRLRTEAPAVSNIPWPRIAGAAALLLLVGAAAVVEAVAPARRGSRRQRECGGESRRSIGRRGQPTRPPAAALRRPAISPGGVRRRRRPPHRRPQAAPPAQATPAEVDATAGVGRARLRLSFSADSWVDVHDAAGRRVFAGNGRANSMKTIAGIAPMRVYLGFASGVQLEVNDRAVAIGPQFVAGDVARFEAGADGVLRRDSHSAAAPGGASPHGARPSD